MKQFFKNLKYFILDIKVFFEFRRLMKRDLKDENSIPSQFACKLNFIGNIVYTQLSLPAEYIQVDEYNRQIVIIQKLKQLNEYLSMTLNFNEYIYPQLVKFTSEIDEESLSYGILYVLDFYQLSWKSGIKYTIILMLILSGIIFSFLKYILPMI